MGLDPLREGAESKTRMSGTTKRETALVRLTRRAFGSPVARQVRRVP
jgi:hypothetical protein